MRVKQNAVRGHKHIAFALPREILKAAELPRKLYVTATYKKPESSCHKANTRYLVATPSAEMVQRLKAQIALANLGEI